MRNAMVIPVVLVVTLLISLLIGTYLTSSSTRLSKEYYRDLAEVRGYWGAYGAKELNATSIISYTYQHYSIDVNRIGTSYIWEWNLTIGTGSGIKNRDLYIRKITLDNNDSNKTKSYSK